MDNLLDKLQELSRDCQKTRAKKERRLQRSSFRDILRSLEVTVAIIYVQTCV